MRITPAMDGRMNKTSPNNTEKNFTQSNGCIPENPFSLKKFSLAGKSKEMKEKMSQDKFVLDQLALLGQATAIYAKPNTGKTLLTIWMLIESIKARNIDGENVFYVNADDDYKGLVYKLSLAEKSGFHMLAPGHNGFESAALQGYMRQMIDDNTANGAVIILDTLKKFADLMNKSDSSAFMKRGREFVSAGGTLIMLAHTNKSRDSEGKVIFAGTSDIVDDVDCAYTLDEISKTSSIKQVLFENIKSRGAVAKELSFSYSCADNDTYQQRLDSIQMTDKKEIEKARINRDKQQKREKDQSVIEAIIETLKQDEYLLKTKLIARVSDDYGIAKKSVTKVLGEYSGTAFSLDHLWQEVKGDHNATTYKLLSDYQATATDYRFAKDRE